MFSVVSILAAAEEPNGLWLPHDINEVIWGSLAFFIVVGFLGKKLGPLVKAVSVGRTARIEAELDGAAAALTDAESERDGIKSALADSAAEAARIIAEARTSADAVAAEIDARAQVEAAAIKDRAVGDLAAAQRQAVADLTSEISRLALGAAEQVVHQNLDAASQQALIEQYITQVGASN